MAAAEAISCRRCGGAMERGYLLDHGYPSNVTSMWLAGTPRKGFWGGLKITREARATAKHVEAWRCRGCGLVDLFARESPAAGDV